MAQLHDSSQFSISKQQLFPQEEMLEIKKKRKELTIGIPKENWEFENRVCITPQAVQLLSDNGHKILFESGAGDGSNYSDLEYSEVGAEIISDKKRIFKSEIVLKVSPFNNKEIELLDDNRTVISALHISSQSKEQIYGLMKKRVKAIAFEYIKNESSHYPIVRSMSEIAGKLSINIASEYLSKQHGGKGVLLGGITGISPAEVVIIGAGTTAEHAAYAAHGLGAMIKVFDYSIYKLRDFQRNMRQQVFTSVIQPQALAKALKSADVVIGAMDIDEKTDKFVITENMVQQMKKGTIIIDLNSDSGSCFESSKPTTYKNPAYIKFGVVHYCVRNIASRTARTASIALSNVLTPILLKIGDEGGITKLLKTDRGIRNGAYIFNGILTSQSLGIKFGIRSKDINLLMAAF
ncbi:MAG: alanine dehydrogenase [Bacteroidetes bacterium 4572_117]|nr:MAG: alanine dehydrogenase [Bacteroidetes bacterium 4572_117]